ncbi:Low-affinity potassium transport protein [Podosphaera aphanis]|nr:Low-affinity potassium transport protein [Podosphaera aphanis]
MKSFRSQLVAVKDAFPINSIPYSFIAVHYFLIISTTICGSILLYVAGNVEYIDSIFLACGSATQSGLNTIDLNRLNTWQQAVLYVIPMITNPITINTFVVFVRLWWFEKKFQHVVREARRNRRSASVTLSKADQDDREERGVSGQKITVMHSQRVPSPSLSEVPNYARSKSVDRYFDSRDASRERISMFKSTESYTISDNPESSRLRNGSSSDQTSPKQNFNVAEKNHLPLQISKDEHIAFLQRQRNHENGEVLRIPGPRDADAGMAPLTVNDDQDSTYRNRARRSEDYDRPKRNVTIEEPIREYDSYLPSSPNHASKQNDGSGRKLFGALRMRKPAAASTRNYVQNSKAIQSLRSVLSPVKDEAIPYLSWQPTIGRNSTFPDLSEEQRDELGGIEYRSLKTLALVLVLYFWGFTLLGIICLVPWIYRDSYHGNIVLTNGISKAWWGIFTANSAFTDLGFTLTPDSMISFHSAIWPLLIMSFLITIGNTAFPIMLRILIWVGARFSRAGSGLQQELNFLLDHPRRCFTLLFPAKATLWLLGILILMNGLDVFFFFILDLGKTVVTELPRNLRALDGFFQAISTRTAGFAVIDLSMLHPAIQVSYLMMMYISVLPIAISVRRTNVYEERSLGIYGSLDDEEDEGAEHSYIATHLRHQLSFDLWYICMGLFIISISEGDRLQGDDSRFTMFSVLFEIISAYGNVGLSLGYKGIDASLSAEFGIIAKIVIIAMQIRGRHRGLPNKLDRAIILPSEKLLQVAEEDLARLNRRRHTSNASDMAGPLSRTMSRSTAGEILGAVFLPGPPLPRNYRNLQRVNSYGRDSSTTSRNRSKRPYQSRSPSVIQFQDFGTWNFDQDIASPPTINENENENQDDNDTHSNKPQMQKTEVSNQNNG